MKHSLPHVVSSLQLWYCQMFPLSHLRLDLSRAEVVIVIPTAHEGSTETM